MVRTRGRVRAILLGFALIAIVGVVAIPALAAGPSAAPGGDGGAKGSKASKEPEVAVTLHGTVTASAVADGTTAYSMTVDGKTVRLEAGPPWFFGDKHPLAPFAGKTVTITGEQRGDGVDVETVDGQRIRAEGRPPWAGGWKAVGSAHPGWSQEKADRWAQHQAGKADKVHGKDDADGPEASEAPGS